MNCDGNLILPQVICCKASYLLAWQDSLHDHHHRGILIEQICKITSLRFRTFPSHVGTFPVSMGITTASDLFTAIKSRRSVLQPFSYHC